MVYLGTSSSFKRPQPVCGDTGRGQRMLWPQRRRIWERIGGRDRPRRMCKLHSGAPSRAHRGAGDKALTCRCSMGLESPQMHTKPCPHFTAFVSILLVTLAKHVPRQWSCSFFSPLKRLSSKGWLILSTPRSTQAWYQSHIYPLPIIAQILERNVAPIKVSRVKMEMRKSQRDIYFSSS